MLDNNEGYIPQIGLPNYLGCLSLAPYRVSSESELSETYSRHRCPGCQSLPAEKKDPCACIVDVDAQKISALSTPCSCGFDVPFIALVAEHIESVVATPELEIETLLFHCSVQIHLKKYESVLAIFHNNPNLLQQSPLANFYQAYCFEMGGSAIYALLAYDRCLDLDRCFQTAWHNRARLLKQLGRLQEAQFCLVKYHQLIVNSRQIAASPSEPNAPSSVGFDHEVGGMFGPVRIITTSSLRYMIINQQVQGSFWLKDNTPSAIPASPYTSGFLLAASDDEWGCGLVFGLGVGASIISLLENFLNLHLTVVEIDPQVISSAQAYFPLLAHYQRQGRLTIITGDAFRFIETTRQHYDVVFLDAFEGKEGVPQKLHEQETIDRLREISRDVVMNIICEHSLACLKQHLQRYQALGLVFCQVIPIVMSNKVPSGRAKESAGLSSNWIVSTKKFNPDNGFVAFAADTGYLATAYRRDVMHIRNAALIIDTVVS
ncbi:MAG: hypothetical protein JKY93_13030 [Gammaproteobacteria bacterium]|nr:hypothetical protein [Gammaproteobacteria bacterium]